MIDGSRTAPAILSPDGERLKKRTATAVAFSAARAEVRSTVTRFATMKLTGHGRSCAVAVHSNAHNQLLDIRGMDFASLVGNIAPWRRALGPRPE